ncbi:ATP-binding cassette domain-containing protein [Aurantimonas sp. A2-1-M11]|uniref:ATP-binding cassette domain-containing protein n=1 Tax=Aurantimonas sp. A2-1-M11 TaxID=3113712 RepID=UPI002F937C26
MREDLAIHSYAGIAPAQASLTDDAYRASVLPIRAENLVFRAGGRTLLDVAGLTIAPGAPTLILGPNGAGKSLLLRLLHGLIAPASGRMSFNGQAIGPRVRRRQAMVFQRPVLLRRSVAANIDYALKVHGLARAARRERVAQLLAIGDLADRGNQPARTLSGGEQQRLAVVRAISTSPDILFMDEPTSSLDPGATQAIEILLRRVADAGTKIVMVTHDIGQARRLGAEIVFVHRGRITEQTPGGRFFDEPLSQPAREFLAGGLVL